MKKTVIVIFLGFTFFGCTDKKAQEKALLDEVIAVHDKVMNADERLMKNKMQLDTLLKKANLPAKDTAALLHLKLVEVDSAMENWMHKFDPDHIGKSHDETMSYFSDQKKQIMAIDSQLNAAVDQSTKYLIKVKTK